MKNTKVVSEFLNLCHFVHQKGLVSGSGGNISFRIDDRFLITPSGRSLESLQDHDVILMNRDGSFEGTGKPSKEWRMHLQCYLRDDITVIIHVHSVYSVAVSCLSHADTGCALPVYTPGYGLVVGELPIIPYLMPGSRELANSVAGIIARRNSVMMANHGILAAGSSAEQALNIIEEIEENAQLHFILNGNGSPLSAMQRAELSALRKP